MSADHDLTSMMILDAGDLNAVAILCPDAACSTMNSCDLNMFTKPDADCSVEAQAIVGAT
jgi:hypothetical protein